VKALKDFCPRKLYNLTKNYFTERTAYIATNSMRIEKAVNKDVPKGPAVDQDTGTSNTIHC